MATGDKEEIMASKVLPIKPDEVEKEKERILPDAVLESFNELIAQHHTNGWQVPIF